MHEQTSSTLVLLGALIAGSACADNLAAPTPELAVVVAADRQRSKPRATSSDIVPLPFFVRSDGGLPIGADTRGNTPIYDAIVGNPILTPDGLHVTWGQWGDVAGRLRVRCERSGSRIALHLSGLIPDGVYTIWNVVFEQPGFTGEFVVPGSIPANATGFGPVGSPTGERSGVRASKDGRARISVVTPGGPLGSAGEIGKCALTDEFEWHVVGLYHVDGQSYGSVRGPEGTRAEQFAFIFRRGS